MTDLERIKQSTELQMALSEMLFKALGLGCWHYIESEQVNWLKCSSCGFELRYKPDNYSVCQANPNLFSDWTGFGIVWEASKNIDGFHNNFLKRSDDALLLLIATPRFQLKALEWLVGKDKINKTLMNF